MTELAGNATFLGPAEHRRAAADDPRLLGSCGRPGPMADVRVVDAAGNDVAAGGLGEIVVRGDQVTIGYWRDPEATRDAMVDAWFRTGDLGRIDADGYLYVIDRAKDIIITGGENVASLEVEDAILALDGVAAVAVVAVPDAHWGEAVCAVVVRRPGARIEPTDVIDAVRHRLAGFKKPRHVLFVDSLPVNHAGKVVKAEVRRTAAAAIEAG
jgi:acyl-CoA synthetase (AMP-forming)/AMP-acid ligase II